MGSTDVRPCIKPHATAVLLGWGVICLACPAVVSRREATRLSPPYHPLPITRLAHPFASITFSFLGMMSSMYGSSVG
jgi:hypothetical protein